MPHRQTRKAALYQSIDYKASNISLKQKLKSGELRHQIVLDHRKAENVSLATYCQSGKYDALMDMYDSLKPKLAKSKKTRNKAKSTTVTKQFYQKHRASFNKQLSQSLDHSLETVSLRNEYQRMFSPQEKTASRRRKHFSQLGSSPGRVNASMRPWSAGDG